MTEVLSKIAAILEKDGLVCIVCGEPFGCEDDTTVKGEYDCWVHGDYGPAHHGCLNQVIKAGF